MYSARSSNESLPHDFCASRARATAACTCSAVAHSNSPIGSSVAGLFAVYFLCPLPLSTASMMAIVPYPPWECPEPVIRR